MSRYFWREGLLLKMWRGRFARLGRLRWMFVLAFGRMGNWIGRRWLDFSPQCRTRTELPRKSKNTPLRQAQGRLHIANGAMFRMEHPRFFFTLLLLGGRRVISSRVYFLRYHGTSMV